MQLDNILGNEGVTAAIKTALAAGRLPHAVLIAAPEGCGRGFAARSLAADYLYPQGGRGAAAVMRGESPEVLLVQGEGKSGQIPVARVREVRGQIYHSALSAAGRVVWIRDAQRMAAPAFNALLKVLEEPPAGALFVLTAPDSASLPLTIVSRCTVYTLAPLPLRVCEQALQQAAAALPAKPALAPALLAALYGGCLGLGLRLLRGEGAARATTVQDALALARAAVAGNRYEMLRLLASYEGRADGERERREALLFNLAAALESALRGADAAVFGGQGIAPVVAAALLGPVGEAQGALRGNVAPKIVFTALVVQLGRAVAA